MRTRATESVARVGISWRDARYIRPAALVPQLRIPLSTLPFLLAPAGLVLAEGLPVSLSDRGGVGLLTIPSARFAPEGTLTTSVTEVRGLERGVSAALTPVPWFEMIVRDALASDMSLADPAVDLKFRLVREGPYRPAIVLGALDATGSSLGVKGEGRHAAEYLAASRRWWDFDLTLGLGWGRLGEGGELPNPLSILGGRYARARPFDDPNRRGADAWFTGRRVGLFGGVEWITPLSGISLKAEWGGERFALEKAMRPSFHAGTPLSLGLSWRVAPEVELGAGWENGRRLMWRISALLGPANDERSRTPRASSNVGDLNAWLTAPGRWLRSVSGTNGEAENGGGASHAIDRLLPDARRPSPGETGATVGELAEIARNAGVRVRAVRSTPDEATMWIDAGEEGPVARDVGRAARVLAGLAEAGVERVTIAVGRNGVGESAIEMSREDLLRVLSRRGSAEEVWNSARPQRPDAVLPPGGWSTGMIVTASPVVEESLFEHAATVVARSHFDTSIRIEPARGWSVEAGGRMRIADGTASLDATALPVARPVRSDLAIYAKERFAPTRLALSWSFEPAGAWRTRITAGALEEMFSGVSFEALRHDANARWAVGVVADRVWKRRPGPTLALKSDAFTDARVVARLEAPGRVDGWFGLEAGRYLAGDLGVTAEFARVMSDRLTVGGHLTWTDGSARGPYGIGGRFDIGLSVALNFHPIAGLPILGRAETRVVTLGRDSGQRVDQPRRLWDDVRAGGAGRLLGGWTRAMD